MTPQINQPKDPNTKALITNNNHINPVKINLKTPTYYLHLLTNILLNKNNLNVPN